MKLLGILLSLAFISPEPANDPCDGCQPAVTANNAPMTSATIFDEEGTPGDTSDDTVACAFSVSILVVSTDEDCTNHSSPDCAMEYDCETVVKVQAAAREYATGGCGAAQFSLDYSTSCTGAINLPVSGGPFSPSDWTGAGGEEVQGNTTLTTPCGGSEACLRISLGTSQTDPGYRVEITNNDSTATYAFKCPSCKDA